MEKPGYCGGGGPGGGAGGGRERKKGNSKKLDLKYNLNREKNFSPVCALGGGIIFQKDLKKRGLLRLFYLFDRL